MDYPFVVTMKYLKQSEWKEGEFTEYGFKVESGILTGNSGAWPIKSIRSIQCKEAPKSGLWETLGWSSTYCVSAIIDGQEIEIMRLESSVLEGSEAKLLRWQMCSQVVSLVQQFMKQDGAH